MWLNGILLHIPRTGGIGIRGIHSFSSVWHSAGPVPTSCNLFTALRNETDRYCSEWNFYGARFFAKNKSVKGWIPKSRPKTFQEFSNDSSTHNAMVRILSGCQLYDTSCVLTEGTVDAILSRVKNGCIRILRARRKRIHSNSHVCSRIEYETSYRVNHLDRLLLERLSLMNVTGWWSRIHNLFVA